ncbi:MAG TPA: hypothetical protein VF729_07625 [Solirubrobacterales bacterium]
MKFVFVAGGLSLAAFGVLWTLLEPIGGFETINDAASRNVMNYITLCIVSLAVGTGIALKRSYDAQADGARGAGGGTSRLEVDFRALLSNAKDRIIVVGISLPTFTNEAGLRVVRDALKRKVRVDLVFVNPGSPAILQRPSRLYQSYDGPAIAAAASLRACLRFRGELDPEDAPNFRIHLTNFLPSCAAVIIDESCLWHPYFVGHTGASSPYLRGNTSGGFGREVLKHVLSVIEEYSVEPKSCEWDALSEMATKDPLVRREFTAPEKKSIRSSLSL